MRRILFLLVAASTAFGCKHSTTNTPATNDMGTDTSMTNGADTGGGGDAGGQDATTADAGTDMAPEGVYIEGLSAPATVRFDQWGVLHVDCQTDEDCAAVEGYYHARDRFEQMDLNRRIATGRVSALIGGAALDFDVSMRQLLSTRDGQPLGDAVWQASSDKTKAMIQAYTNGVNAWIADFRAGRNGATISDEYNFPLVHKPLDIPDWTPQDSIAGALLLLNQLSNSGDDDLMRGDLYSILTPEQAFDLAGTMSVTGNSTMAASGETYNRVQMLRRYKPIGDLNAVRSRLRRSKKVIDMARKRLDEMYAFMGSSPHVRASNNWVLGPSLTGSGHPILANDPHLALTNPALWYLVELNSKANGGSLHVTGVSLPGLPGVLLGHNENIAWGATVVFYDLSDVYTEQLSADGKSVMFNGNQVPIIEKDETFDVAGSQPVTKTLRWVPHHGPVLSYDAANQQAVSLRWTGNDARTDVDMFYDLIQASTVDEAKQAFMESTSTNQNWIVADMNGDIGWFPFDSVPERKWASLSMPPWAPLPGDGTAEWGNPIPLTDLPQMKNPANGFVATANNDPTGAWADGDPTNDPYGYLSSYGEFAGFRQQEIVDRINNDATHDGAESRDMQASTFMVMRDWILPPVKAVVDADPSQLSAAATTYWGTLDGWDGTCPTGLTGSAPDAPKSTDPTETAASIGCAAFHYLVANLTEKTFGDELKDTSLAPTSLEGIRSLAVLLNRPQDLMGGEVYWDDVTTSGTTETKTDTILAAIEAAAADIADKYGSTTPDDWRWGYEHQLERTANLFDGAGFKMYNDGPYAAKGGWFTIDVANPNDASSRDWTFSHGPSMRHVSVFGTDGITSYWALPGGQRHHRDSPFYDNLLEDWLNTNSFEMPFKPADVQSAAMETITVNPAPGQ